MDQTWRYVMLKFNELDANFQMTERRGLCPVCGRSMTQTDRLKEGKNVFIWYKCMNDECGGQRLQKQSVK
jgi:hypothetical protein